MNEVRKPHVAAVVSAFAIVYLVWGSTYLAIRFAVETMPPYLMAGVRFVVAGWAMYVYLLMRGQFSITMRQWLAAGFSGVLMLLGGNGLVCWAEQMVPSGVTALIVGTAPLWIVGIEWLGFGGSRPSLAVVIGLVLGLVGVAILAGPSDLVGSAIEPMPALALLAACVFWAWGSMASKSKAMPTSAVVSVTAQMLAGGTALLLVSAALGEPQNFDLNSVSTESWLALAYLIVFGAILAFTCYNWLFRVCKPAHVATYAYVNPIVAVFLGWWLADEVIGSGTLTAAALILAGVFLVTIRKKKSKSKSVSLETAKQEPELAAK